VTNQNCAFRQASDKAEQRLLTAYFERHGVTGAVEFARIDDDRLDAALCAGQYERVIFANLDALLEAIWKGYARPDRWVKAEVRIEFADGTDPDRTRDFVLGMYDSLSRWRQANRRRQIVAAAILSAIALAAMMLLLLASYVK